MAVKKGLFKKIIAVLAFMLGCFVLGNAIGYGVDYVSTSIGDFINQKHKDQILEKIPEEFRSNYYFRWFGLGDCEYMTGNVTVTFVFVDDDLSVWTEDQRAAYKAEAEKVFDQIEADAKSFGAELALSTQYKTAKSTGELSLKAYMDWVNTAISSAGLPDYSEMGTKLEEEYDADHAPVIFLANRDGRCFTRPSSVDRKSEFAILFEDTDSLYHEFCHIFGAEDFYYPDEVKEIANKHLPNSLMNSKGKTVDSFTAFLIGWTDSLDDGATEFLKATNHITDEYMKTQYADETYTGYVENKTIGDTTYTGKLVDGILEGVGRKERNGNVWEGTFKGGLLNGYGSYTSENGNTYVGNFVDGKCQGFGKYTWKSGDSYEGEFVNGVREGIGTYKWSNGDSYIGSYKNGKMHGTGTLKWANGDVYTGDFFEGVRAGKGTLTWADGDIYVGEFKNGKIHGYGVLTYKSGNVRKGNWENGKFIG